MRPTRPFVSSFASPSGPIRLPPLVAINSSINSFRIVIRFSYRLSFRETAFTQSFLHLRLGLRAVSGWLPPSCGGPGKPVRGSINAHRQDDRNVMTLVG